MSEPLEDLRRLKVTNETMRWLRWRALVTGQSFAEVAREALHIVATTEMDKCIHDHKVLSALKIGEGQERDTPGNVVKTPLREVR